MASDDEDALLRALADPDPTVQRIAAVRAHKVALSSPARVVAALEPLLAHDDKYLRRAAAASYVVMHPRGPAAPALRPLHEDPADIVVLTARGALRDRGHEMAELVFVVRTLAHATQPASTAFATTVGRWHRFLYNYSPNLHAATATSTVTSGELDRDAERLRDIVATIPRAHPIPRAATMFDLGLDDDQLVVRARVHGKETWVARTPAALPALRRLAGLTWDVEDAPWPGVFAAGTFALAIAAAIVPVSTAWLGDADERELATSLAGEQIFLGFLRASGVAFAD